MRSARLVRIHNSVCRFIDLVRTLITRPASLAGQHDARPSFTGGTSKKHQNGLAEGMKVDVPIVLRVRVEANVTKDLHAYDGVDEEEHGDQEDDIR